MTWSARIEHTSGGLALTFGAPLRNPLDEISGIGPTRKRALLRHFGTAKAVSRASVEDLVAVEGISRQMAQLVYDHFHEQAS